MVDTILKKFEIRKSFKEKSSFIQYLSMKLEVLGYKVKVESSGRGLFKSRNIIVGDLNEAKVILTAHYDTCAWCPFPNMMAPTNPFLFVFFQLMTIVFAFGLAFLLYIPFVMVFPRQDMWVYKLVLDVIILLICYQVMFGFRNKHTANDNTSGVVTLVKFLEELDESDRDKVCVVFFDNEEKGLLGSASFKRRHSDVAKNKPLINLDCVGDGRNLALVIKNSFISSDVYSNLVDLLKNNNHFKVHIKRGSFMFPSDQVNFNKGAGICTLNRWMFCSRLHTMFDTKCDISNVEEIARVMGNLIKEL